MRIQILITLCISFCNADAEIGWSVDARHRESEQVALWEENLKKASHDLPPQKLQTLWIGLKNMGYRKSLNGHSASVDKIYAAIQSEILSIPDHAQYFADLIEEERKRVEHLAPNVGGRIGYDENRRWYIELLAHLPSPETIKVLGHYLADDRDYALAPVPKPGEDPGCFSGGSTGNSTHSVTALENSELRNKPYKLGSFYDHARAKAEWRSWWEEVGTGKKTFSFIGQKVEYRFNPDGSWETIAMVNPPLDGPGSVRRSRRDSAENSYDGSGGSIRWVWITCAGLLALTLAAWIGLKKSMSHR